MQQLSVVLEDIAETIFELCGLYLLCEPGFRVPLLLKNWLYRTEMTLTSWPIYFAAAIAPRVIIDEKFPPGHDRGDDGGGSADAGRAGAGEEEAGAEGREGQIHVEEAMIEQ